MVGMLSPDEIEAILGRNKIGRIGCSVADRPYVVPITYAYDGAGVYCYSTLGRKIEVMRAQPRVCFQVDETDGISNWRCVIAEGTYEELRDEAGRRAALVRLIPPNGSLIARVPDAGRQIVVFRLRLTDKTGRFERCDA